MTLNMNTAARSAYSVVIPFSEASDIEGAYESLDAADRALNRAALLAPKTGAYDKTDFVVTHVLTGNVYRGRLDIQHPSRHGNQSISIAARIESFAKRALASESYPLSADDRADLAFWAARFSA